MVIILQGRSDAAAALAAQAPISMPVTDKGVSSSSADWFDFFIQFDLSWVLLLPTHGHDYNYMWRRWEKSFAAFGQITTLRLHR